MAKPRETSHYMDVILRAKTEAKDLGDRYVSTEHLLLGILGASKDCMALRVLKGLGIDLEEIHRRLDGQLSRGPGVLPGDDMINHPRTSEAIELGKAEARHRKDDQFNTAYLLIGLIREPGGIGGKVLRSCGVEINIVRLEIDKLQDFREE